ncbi:MAG: ThiF family adenylyltransferase, partial [Planctomycetota bacterium]
MSVIDRYDRQRRSLDLGVEGDRRLAALEVLLVGCGGVGCAVAQMLVRSGVGSLRVLDGDVVSESDLHRQCLYYPQDVEAGTPKALAALRELERIGGRPRLAAHPISFT